MGKVAAVGSRDTVLIFKTAGMDVFFIEQHPDFKQLISSLAFQYAVIFVTEDIARANIAAIDKYKSKPYPAVIPIPVAKGTDGFGMENINRDKEKAIGFI